MFSVSIKYLFVSIYFIFFASFIYADPYPIYKKLSSIAVLDQESLFTKSIWGKDILKKIEIRVANLATENRSIEKLLEDEELFLTKKRKIIPKEEFDILSIQFDTKVKKIREEQAEKQRQINNFLNDNKNLFFKKITPILLSFIDELGIEVLLNKDTVALASTGSDITKAAIVKINNQLAD
jgi:Skp family chaperone for outer membrane proteins|tara:strand:- start:329 stop:871 length:543 start_codon:yes stop_codon:yes gene_type:complete